MRITERKIQILTEGKSDGGNFWINEPYAIHLEDCPPSGTGGTFSTVLLYLIKKGRKTNDKRNVAVRWGLNNVFYE